MSSLAEKKLYLDANAFIFAALDSGAKGVAAQKLITRLIEKQEVAFTCSLTIDEVVWKIWKETGDRILAVEQGMRILMAPHIKVLPVGAEEMTKALLSMRDFKKIKPRDAIHAAVASHNDIFSIVSDDSDFDYIEGIKRIPLK